VQQREGRVTDTVIDVRAVYEIDDDPPDVVDITVVMPCLDEEASVGTCVAWAWEGIARTGLRGEVIVADNGSTDRSVAVAEAAGARVVREPRKGYGNAYLAGFAAARGRFIVMGDSDGTYDFREIDRFVAKLDEGYDYVLGNRFGGDMAKGAMPWTHRYIGNPVLTGVLNMFFGLRSSDAHSGMRAFTRESLERMELCCEGMEFASEIVIKAARAELNVAEVPIDYGERTGQSKLKSLRDGWRHLRFMLLLCPKWLFLVPGITLFTIGMVGQSVLLPGRLELGSVRLDVHFNVLFAMTALLGAQAIMFGIFCRTYATTLGLDRPNRLTRWVTESFTLERGLAASLLVFAFGLTIDIWVLTDWLNNNMGPLDAVRQALYALTLVVLGTQGVFASFFLSFFGMKMHAPSSAVRAR
jgi:hypothetical protein